ncbi:hypothetical protein HaLaN_12945, partial [Haematococcus lacustris]
MARHRYATRQRGEALEMGQKFTSMNPPAASTAPIAFTSAPWLQPSAAAAPASGLDAAPPIPSVLDLPAALTVAGAGKWEHPGAA